MMLLELPPFLYFFLAALGAAVTRGTARAVIMLAVPAFSFWVLWNAEAGLYWQWQWLNFEMTVFRVDRLSLLFGYLFHIATLIAVTYALHIKDTVQQTSSLVYAGSALGAVFAGDMLTLFIFWELLALSSVFLIWARKTPQAYTAGMRYLIVQVASGLLLMGGVIIYHAEHGSLSFDYIGLESFASWLIFIAFGIKCAFPFLHNWLTDAYPESTPTGTVFLSAFTTKVAVYCLARAFPGTELLVYIGAAMTCFPIFYAVIENDLRRVLAYSLINQLGFMVVGIGIGTALAINGAVAHAFTDVIFKGLLFMSMGAVLHMTGKINGSELGGLYKTMPKTTILCIIGAASISAFPLFSGFVSKSMIVSAAIAEGYDWVWLMLLFASAGVFHHAGIKIPYFAFFAHDSGIRVSDPNPNMLIAMTIGAVLCLYIGMFPGTLYSLLPFETDYSAYDVTHVLTQVQILFFSALAFVWLNKRGMYPPELPSVNLDAEWLYRRLLPGMARGTVNAAFAADRSVRAATLGVLRRATDTLVFYHDPQGRFARGWSSGAMVTVVVVLLAVLLFWGLL